MTKQRIAILLELPRGESDTVGLRRLLKCMVRAYGMKVLGIRKPEETATFQSESIPNQKAKGE